MAASFLNEPSSEGQIQVIFGPMFSGKSTELLRRVRRYQLASYNCLLIKYENDVRYDKDAISTHDNQALPAQSTGKLYDVKGVEEKEVIGIDEGQFFPDVVDFCEEMANEGKIVIVAALDGTYQRKAFGDVLSLVPLAESVVKLNAVCMQCFKNASFSKRTTDDTQVEVIGGAEKYLAVCRSCFRSSSKVPSARKPPQQASPQHAATSSKTNLSAKLDAS